MKSIYHYQYKTYKKQIDNFIENFKISGTQFGKANRNTIKLFELNNELLNIKAFKIPNIFNQVVYKFFRKSKAQRSFEYANKLIELRINTPKPIAYFENKTLFLFKTSFYVSEHLECDLTYRELSRDLNYPDHENILRAFTRFTFNLHELNINFLDHSPGNTLIKKVSEEYVFYLVDLNRMEFKPMDFKSRINNFSRLTKHISMVEVMSDEYAKCIGEDYHKVFNVMWKSTEDFRNKIQRKKNIKKILRFWK